jgi:hypothetical protein
VLGLAKVALTLTLTVYFLNRQYGLESVLLLDAALAAVHFRVG